MNARATKPNTKSQVTLILGTIPEKNREILERRFGIGRGEAETLESIGRSYGITRERVRQIQEYGLRKLDSDESKEALSPVFSSVQDHIQANSGVVREEDLLSGLSSAGDRPYLSLALKLMPGLIYSQETDDLHARYALENSYLNSADSFVSRVHSKMGKAGTPMKYSDLMASAREEAQGDEVVDDAEAVLSTSKRIQKGPFGEYGLSDWSSIRPRGVRDKAHLVFEKEGKPLHFKELSGLIDKYFKDTKLSRKTHPQTVHNELIKDKRFVLIGRGLYALNEWGYEPGTVRDVLVSIFKEQGKSLDKDEVLGLVSKKRVVKPNTIFLNLQNKEHFKKQTDGRYFLA